MDEAHLPSEEMQSDEAGSPRDLRLPAALVRTALSSEQTLMSWVRTSLSLFTFGFSITQFFHFLALKQEDPEFSAGPRRLGISLICVGILVLVLAVVDQAVMQPAVAGARVQRDEREFVALDHVDDDAGLIAPVGFADGGGVGGIVHAPRFRVLVLLRIEN